MESKPDKIERLRREVKREFPHDKALQEIHLARLLILEEAKESGDDLMRYVRQASIEGPGIQRPRKGTSRPGGPQV